MKYILTYRVGDFEKVDVEITGEPEDVVSEYLALKKAFSGGEGVGMKTLAKILHEYCSTGSIVDGGNYDFSLNEKTLLGEVKKLIRKSN